MYSDLPSGMSYRLPFSTDEIFPSYVLSMNGKVATSNDILVRIRHELMIGRIEVKTN